jgi:hypothetical protein
MRIALISTPRSGNTWIRKLLANIYDLHEFAAHNPNEINWCALPENVIVQIHWRHTESFRETLKSNSFRVVTISRHPLDVLISILHFSQHSKNTKNWLNGYGGDESSLLGVNPLSSSFLDYSVGKRVQALLEITSDWKKVDSTINVSYEAMVSDQIGTLRSLTSMLGGHPGGYDEAIRKNGITELRKNSGNFHFWQGRPNLWSDLLTLQEVLYIRENQMGLANSEYNFGVDKHLTSDKAINNWKLIKA